MSLACRTALRTSLRCLHTSLRVYNESSSSAPTGASLGFGDYTGRTRKLPTIPISPSSQSNVLRSRAPKATSSTEQRAKKETGKPRQIRQGRSPAQPSSRQSKSQGTESEVAASGEDDFFGDVTPRARGSGMEKVDMDFSAPVKIASAGKSRGKGRASTSTPSSTTRERRARAPVVPEVEDRSPEGIFGRASLLFPVQRGAREAERSVWAENLQPADARKAEVSRLAGSASVYLPDRPLPTDLTGKNASQASKMLGSWLLSTNPGVSMRRAKGAEAVISSYLK